MRGSTCPTVAGLLDAHVSQDWVQGGAVSGVSDHAGSCLPSLRVWGGLPSPHCAEPGTAHAGVGWSPSEAVSRVLPCGRASSPHVAAVERVRGKVGEV